MGGRCPSALYLHVPFCAARCDYCSFATWTDRHHLTDAYLAACRADADRLVADGPARGHLGVRRRRHAVDGARRRARRRCSTACPRAAGCEVTVECNPDDVTAELVDTYLAGGVNRISLGVQSTSPHVLAALGRTHDRANVERAVEIFRAAGLADVQPRPDLRRRGGVARRLVRARSTTSLALDPPHVSAYALTVEAGTPLAADTGPPPRRRRPGRQVPRRHRAPRRGRARAGTRSPTGPGPATSAATTSSTGRWASTRASAARPHSHRDGRRFWNLRTPDRYIDAVRGGRHAWRRPTRRLDADGRALEALQLALRTRDGRAGGGARRRRTSPASSSRRPTTPTASSSRWTAACSPTRSPCASGCRSTAVPRPYGISVHLVRSSDGGARVGGGGGRACPSCVASRDGPDAAGAAEEREALAAAAGPGVLGVLRSGPAADGGWELVTEHGGPLPVGHRLRTAVAVRRAGRLGRRGAGGDARPRRHPRPARRRAPRARRRRRGGWCSTGSRREAGRRPVTSPRSWGCSCDIVDELPETADRREREAARPVRRTLSALERRRPPDRLPPARRLAQELAAAPRPPARPPRMPARRSPRVVVLAGAVLVAIGGRRRGPAHRAASAPARHAVRLARRPPGDQHDGAAPAVRRVRGGHRSRPESTECAQSVVGRGGRGHGRRPPLVVGRHGDEVLVADWGCEGRARPAVLRPDTGEVVVFGPVDAPGGPVGGAAERTRGRGPTSWLGADDGCAALLVVTADGSAPLDMISVRERLSRPRPDP